MPQIAIAHDFEELGYLEQGLIQSTNQFLELWGHGKYGNAVARHLCLQRYQLEFQRAWVERELEIALGVDV